VDPKKTDDLIIPKMQGQKSLEAEIMSTIM